MASSRAPTGRPKLPSNSTGLTTVKSVSSIGTFWAESAVQPSSAKTKLTRTGGQNQFLASEFARDVNYPTSFAHVDEKRVLDF